MRLPRVWFASRPSFGTTTVTPGSRSPREGLIMLAVMLATLCACAVINRGPAVPPPRSVRGAAAPPATPICRGTIVSIAIDETALRDELRRHNSLWVVTIRPDDRLLGSAPGREMRFTMHSPAMSGFRRVGERVEVYSDDGRGLRA